MLTRDSLLKVGGLKLSEKINKMDDVRFGEYCTTLDLFVKSYPSLESDLKNSLGLRNYDALCANLQRLASTLQLIYAEDLAQNCIKFSTEVKGSRFEVIEAYFAYLLTSVSMLSIDIQIAQSGGEAAKADAPDTNGGTGREKTILAVDDVSLTLNGLKLILQNTSYKLICVTSGQAALRYLVNHSPDLFILDIEMPLMNGYELAKKVREKGHKAPIIFLTGNATQDYVRKALQAGAVDFIVKPVNKEFVLEKIRKQIG